MFHCASHRPLTILSIILALISITHSGCYQKQLCCLGHNFTCFATDDGTDHLSTKLSQQKLAKGQEGNWRSSFHNRKMERTNKLVLPLDNMELGAVSGHGHDLPSDYLKSHENQPKTVTVPNSSSLSPFAHHELIFGQPFYPPKEQPETIRYYRRHKLIRYSLLSRHIPLTVKDARGVEWSPDDIKLTLLGNAAHEILCYCDEKCVTFDDCCSDYSFACPPSDCVVSQWSAWSQCISDEGNCEVGIRTRRRTIARNAEHGGMQCPSLIEKISCFKECPKRTHQPETRPVALILDYSYNKTREAFSDRKGGINKRDTLLYYCGIYEFGWVNSNCIDKKIRRRLYTGNNVCVECQPEAQLHSSADICTSDLNDGETGFWKLIGPKSCNGAWKKLSRTDSCRCEINFPKHDAFLFV